MITLCWVSIMKSAPVGKKHFRVVCTIFLVLSFVMSAPISGELLDTNDNCQYTPSSQHAPINFQNSTTTNHYFTENKGQFADGVKYYSKPILAMLILPSATIIPYRPIYNETIQEIITLTFL